MVKYFKILVSVEIFSVFLQSIILIICLSFFVRGCNFLYDGLRILEGRKLDGLRVLEGRELDYLSSLWRRFTYEAFDGHINKSKARVSGLNYVLGYLEAIGYGSEA